MPKMQELDNLVDSIVQKVLNEVTVVQYGEGPTNYKEVIKRKIALFAELAAMDSDLAADLNDYLYDDTEED